ncbi:MAG TPA: ribokinase [Aestuariivirga sp.]|nr:ribokinase [Aestuariivirga sp.]
MKPIVILGVFVADTAYRADRQPRMGETILGHDFKLGPGGKGSNQAVAVGRLAAPVHFITRTGDDAFAAMAEETWKKAGVTPSVTRTPTSYTGAAYIFIEQATGNNAIIVSPGAARLLTPADLDERATLIGAASIFMTQLEQPLDAAMRGLEIARAAGVTTILNPAPGADLPDSMIALCDYLTPNESEAEALTGIAVTGPEDGRQAAEQLIARGAGSVIVTLGEKGALLVSKAGAVHMPAVSAGKVLDTTGAGDAFNGGFAVALARGLPPEDAVRFGCCVAGISVTRPGTAPAMPDLAEAEALFGRKLA